MDSTHKFVIETNDLGKSYKNVTALKKLNLSVAPNSIFGFLGPNGAGKTTTIKLLLGLIRPSRGSAKIFGQDIVEDSIEIRSRVGYLQQEPHFYDYMTARETLRFTARFFFKGPKQALENHIQETLDLVGLADKADRKIKGFSGGERQRLGIAQAQVNQPDLLILDEPAANLDPMGRRDVLQVMERLREHATIFYSTHILDDVQRVSDTVAILNHGQLVAQAPVSELLSSNGDTIYNLTIKGDSSATKESISQQPWVSSLETVAQNGHTQWQVKVTDSEQAEDQLLRLVLANKRLTVQEFGRKQYDLEEVFVSLVEGEHHG